MFRVWVAKRPKLATTGATLDDALDRLSSVICKATGDGEAAISLWPLPPAQPWDAKYAVLSGALLVGDGCVHPVGDGRELFTRGWCDGCHAPRGRRTDAPITVDQAGEGDVCDMWWKHGMRGLDYSPLVVSERFLKLLTTTERRSGEWRSLTQPKRCRVKYFEWLPAKVIPKVCVRGWKRSGWRCAVCGYECFSSSNHPTGGSEHDSLSTIIQTRHASKLMPFIGVSRANSQMPFLPIERVAAFMSSPHSKGMRLWSLGAVPPSMVLKRPKLPLRDRRTE